MPIMRDELKRRVYEFLKSHGSDGAMLDDLLDDPEIGSVGRQSVSDALKELQAENKVVGRDPIYGWVVRD